MRLVLKTYRGKPKIIAKADMNEPNILIKNAVFEAMSHIASGDTPTEALRKTAEAHDLNANYIQRVGEVMNVTLHHEHFKTAAD